MKVKAVSGKEAEEILAKNPTRKAGLWKELIEKVAKTGEAQLVTEISRGQSWSATRMAREHKLSAKVIDKGTGILIYKPKVEENRK